jgi:hypothetical protein
MNRRLELIPKDLLAATSTCRAAFAPALDRDWEVPARDLEWTCRRTLDHVADTLLLYAAHLATRATERRPPPRNGDPTATPVDLLTTVESCAATLAEVVRAVPPGTRAFHPAGMADATGFVGMGCEEILAHAWDIAEGLGVPIAPSDDLAARVVTRLFPWVPTDVSPWEALLWATGQIAPPGRTRLGPDWFWHCAPLAESDGTITKRTAPPTWR